MIINLLVLLVFFGPWSWFSPFPAAGQTSAKGIPGEIQVLLEKKHPGWRLGQVSPEVKEFFREKGYKFPPNLVTGDFDGNGKTDYGVKIVAQGKWQVLAFLQKGDGFAEHLLASGEGPGLDVYLALYRRGEKGFNFETGRFFFFDRDSPEIGYFEKASVVFIYDSGKFKEIYTSD